MGRISFLVEVGLAANLSDQLRLVGFGGYEAPPRALSERERYAAWESGNADFRGADAFANIQAKLDAAVGPADSKPSDGAEDKKKKSTAKNGASSE